MLVYKKKCMLACRAYIVIVLVSNLFCLCLVTVEDSIYVLGGVVFVLSGGLRHNYVSLFSPGAATGSSHPRGVLFNIRDLKIDVYGKPPSNRILTSTVRCSNLCAFDQS